jgi:hypothetical protein
VIAKPSSDETCCTADTRIDLKSSSGAILCAGTAPHAGIEIDEFGPLKGKLHNFLLSANRLSQKKLLISSSKQHLMDQRFRCKGFFLTRSFIVLILL